MAPRKTKSVVGRHGGRPISRGAAIALQALKEGNCAPERQPALINWLVSEVCGVHSEPFDPNSERNTIHRLGRRSVGLDILDHLTVNIGELSDETETKSA